MFSDVLSGWQKRLMETDGIWLLLTGRAQFLQFLCRTRHRARNQQFVGWALAWERSPSPSLWAASFKRGVILGWVVF